ncbi:MAG: SMP-30/gluconolactonase/LRE family protein [Parvularculaceae bacterium]|nr:SMP-30/gluconolactonase/LRE family protein [Caulobacterales bacterium]
MKKALTGEAECIAPVGAVLGEGPLWDPRAGKLVFLDIKGERIFRIDPETRALENYAVPGMISAVGLRESGGYVASWRNGFTRLFIEDGAVKQTPIVTVEADQPTNRFNDGKVDPKGGFWAGTMDDDEKEVSGSWWRLAPDGRAQKKDTGFKVTNGPAFDQTRGRMFLTDSAAQTIFTAESDGATFENKRTFLQFGKGDGYPDGMEVDCEGCLWVAFWAGSAVRRFSPDGELLETLPLPVRQPTSVAFAGDRLFITSAKVGLSEERLKEAPLSGGLFMAQLARPLGAETALFRG